MAHLPQARWMHASVKRDGAQTAQLRVSDIEAAIEAVAAGYGRSILPCLIADRDARLIRKPLSKEPKNLTRELWLLVHSELSELHRTQAVTKWIEEVIPKEANVG